MKIHFIYTEDSFDQRHYICFIKNVLYYFYPNVVYIDAAKGFNKNAGTADLVVLFNYRSYEIYQKQLQPKTCVIYISCPSSMVELAKVDADKVDGFIHMPDSGKNNGFCCCLVPAFTQPVQQDMAHKDPDILIVNDCHNHETDLLQALVKIANGCFNKFGQNRRVTFLTRLPVPGGLLDESITKVTEEKKDDFEKQFTEACGNHQVVIARGIFAQLACGYMANVIVVGERGYGGNVTVSTVEDHLQHGFAGRLGGYIGEFIPDGFVLKEIDELRKKRKANIEARVAVYEKLSVLHETARDKTGSFISRLMQVKTLLTNHFTDLTFGLSGNYQLIDLNEKCFLVNKQTNRREYELGRQEFMIAKKFIQTVSIKDLFSLCETEEEKANVKEFVSDLFINKVLECKNQVNGY